MEICTVLNCFAETDEKKYKKSKSKKKTLSHFFWGKVENRVHRTTTLLSVPLATTLPLPDKKKCHSMYIKKVL